MSIEQDIFDGLTDNALLFALVNNRVFPHSPRGFPQREQLPAITYQQISGISQFTHSGRAEIMQGRFQFNALGRTVLEVNEVVARLIPAIEEIPNTKITAMEGPRDGSDPTVTVGGESKVRGLPWKSLDVFMWYLTQQPSS